MYSANRPIRRPMKHITSTLTLSLICCYWLFHRIFNPGINPGIPELQNPNPEILGLGSGPRIANTTRSAAPIGQLLLCSFMCLSVYYDTIKQLNIAVNQRLIS